jgi:hypothetical protein
MREPVAPDPVSSLSQHSLRVADQVYYRQLDDISVVGWSNGIVTDVGQKPAMADRASREFYSDALFDLIRLLEEVRFEIAFAAMLAADYRARNLVDAPEVQHLDVDGTVIEMTLSIEILAVLSPIRSRLPEVSMTTITKPGTARCRMRGWSTHDLGRRHAG